MLYENVTPLRFALSAALPEGAATVHSHLLAMRVARAVILLLVEVILMGIPSQNLKRLIPKLLVARAGSCAHVRRPLGEEPSRVLVHLLALGERIIPLHDSLRGEIALLSACRLRQQGVLHQVVLEEAPILALLDAEAVELELVVALLHECPVGRGGALITALKPADVCPQILSLPAVDHTPLHTLNGGCENRRSGEGGLGLVL